MGAAAVFSPRLVSQPAVAVMQAAVAVMQAAAFILGFCNVSPALTLTLREVQMFIRVLSSIQEVLVLSSSGVSL